MKHRCARDDGEYASAAAFGILIMSGTLRTSSRELTGGSRGEDAGKEDDKRDGLHSGWMRIE